MASKTKVVEPFVSLDDLYSKIESLPQWPEVTKLRGCTDYVHQAKGADLGPGLLNKFISKSVAKTIVCHDMKGGYLEDRYIRGSSAHDSYTFYHWSMIDTFIYFSHKFVTIPPVGWINAAHEHGVKILGTVITEGSKGEAIWQRIFSDEKESNNFADALVHLAKVYNFDGWLLMVGNSIDADKIDNMIYFVWDLTDRIHTEIENSQIIWYDSISTENGQMNPQNELNIYNERFFQNCDGIFLNFHWTNQSLADSYAVAHAQNRPFDVYVGLDVFGRDCPGGGGFHSAYALDVIRQQGLSAAIFAPSWTRERFGPKEFLKIENIFWAQLLPFLYIHVPIFLNETFSTSFCNGAGRKYYHKGRQLRGDKSFYNLSLQTFQNIAPGLHAEFTTWNVQTDPPANVETLETAFETIAVDKRKIKFVAKKPTPSVNYTEICSDYAYEGGTSLDLVFNNETEYHRLFLVWLAFDQTVEVSLVYRIRTTDAWQLDSTDPKPKIVLGNDVAREVLPPAETRDLNSQWRKSYYTTTLQEIHEIGVLLGTTGRCCLGELVIQRSGERYATDKGVPRSVIVCLRLENVDELL